MDKKIASLEALLFIHGEPLTYKKISAVLGIKNDELGPIIDAYRAQLEDSGRGLQLIADKEKIQLATKPEFNKILEDFMKE
ncbi:MAG TPA: SMC-Scp complex subunit ScpB, partial [Candidatus Paceibacterota bacterium]|nr:SMC-Scp complex subunit ScpB [Candidatus Paceibacterota bacterium]